FVRAGRSELSGQAVERVRARLTSSGRSLQLRVFEEYVIEPDHGLRPTYEQLAGRLGLKETDISNHLFAVREQIREEIRAELKETTSTAQEFQEEWIALFG